MEHYKKAVNKILFSIQLQSSLLKYGDKEFSNFPTFIHEGCRSWNMCRLNTWNVNKNSSSSYNVVLKHNKYKKKNRVYNLTFLFEFLFFLFN